MSRNDRKPQGGRRRSGDRRNSRDRNRNNNRKRSGSRDSSRDKKKGQPRDKRRGRDAAPVIIGCNSSDDDASSIDPEEVNDVCPWSEDEEESCTEETADIAAADTKGQKERGGRHDGDELDAGSAFYLADRRFAIPDPKLNLKKPLILNAANGMTEASEGSREEVKKLMSSITPIILESTPEVLSIGRRWMTEGYSFVWPAGHNPYFVDRRGRKINFGATTAATMDVSEPEDFERSEDKTFEEVMPVLDHQLADPEAGELVEGVDMLDERPGPRSRLTHLPKNPFCKTCMRAKVVAARSPRASGSGLYKEAKKFGDVITIDHAIAHKPADWGISKEKALIVALDIATRWLQVYPVKSKRAVELGTSHVSTGKITDKWKDREVCERRSRRNKMPTVTSRNVTAMVANGHSVLRTHEQSHEEGRSLSMGQEFERPVFRRQLAEDGVRPFFALRVRAGELGSRAEFTPAWIEDNLSVQAEIEATHFLKLLNEWTNTLVQGDPLVPMGKRSEDFGENERHRMFMNDTGLVPMHMPWIILSCVNWMEQYPCQSNDIYLVDGDVIDTYGRHLEAGQIDMRFTYATGGREIGGIHRVDMQAMVTSTTVRQEADPFNGDAEREDLENSTNRSILRTHSTSDTTAFTF
eukprot:6247916-Amphidinium_carterae.1